MFLRLPVLLLVGSLLATAAPFTDLIFFGDSLSDTGNVFTATTILSAATFGLFPVQPPAPPYSNGRFSNGPVWTEQVASRLGQPADAQIAGMSLGPLGILPGPGNNYAIGGARTGLGGALGIFDALIPTGVLAQVGLYLGQSAGAADAGALYFLSGGGNDLRDAAKISNAAARRTAAESAADFMGYSLYLLYASGARNFLLMNGPNVGFIPESVAAGLVNQGIEASVYFNFRLSLWTQIFNQLPGLHVEGFDLFGFYNTVFYDTLAGGSQFGFTSATTPCKPGTPGAASCAVSLFFDEIHPTTGLHKLVGNRVADQVLSAWPGSLSMLTSSSVPLTANPEPSTYALVFAALVGGFWTRRRRSRRGISPLKN